MRTVPFVSAAVLALLAQISCAQNTNPTIEASTFVGVPTSDSYPPAGSKYSSRMGASTLHLLVLSHVTKVLTPLLATVNSALFPPESKVGFPGPMPTGQEPAAIQTTPSYPYSNGPSDQFPLVAPY